MKLVIQINTCGGITDCWCAQFADFPSFFPPYIFLKCYKSKSRNSKKSKAKLIAQVDERLPPNKIEPQSNPYNEVRSRGFFTLEEIIHWFGQLEFA